MDLILVLLPLALLLAGIAVGFFVWAVRRGQFDDLETPALRILFEDRPGTKDAGQDGAAEDDGAAAPGAAGKDPGKEGRGDA